MSGKELLRRELNVQSGNNQFSFPNHNLASGIYLLKLTDKNTSGYTKLIVQ
jgi:hypothetical protein